MAQNGQRVKAGDNQATRSSHEATTSLADLGIPKDRASRAMNLPRCHRTSPTRQSRSPWSLPGLAGCTMVTPTIAKPLRCLFQGLPSPLRTVPEGLSKGRTAPSRGAYAVASRPVKVPSLGTNAATVDIMMTRGNLIGGTAPRETNRPKKQRRPTGENRTAPLPLTDPGESAFHLQSTQLDTSPGQRECRGNSTPGKRSSPGG